MITIPSIRDVVENSVVLARCLEHALHIMKFVEGKEDMFVMVKIFLCNLLLGVG
jgi:hypothetical protein